MRRRDFLRSGVGLAVIGSAAGCAGLVETRPYGIPPVLEDRPDRAYLPTHFEGMAMAGMKRSNGYVCALAYTYPHRFWLVTGERTKKVEIRGDDSVHIMPTIWHGETGVRLADASLSLSIEGEDLETDVRPWPMLSQPMGPHFGDNVQLPGKGTYAVSVEMQSSGADPTGALAEASGSASFQFDFEFDPSALEDLPVNEFPERQGELDAVDPMEMEMIPSAQLPEPVGLPGESLGTAESGDMVFAGVALSDAARFDTDGTYLAVSARTPYNRYPIPLTSLSATVSRGGSNAFDDALTARLDPELGYHYGAPVDGLSADDDVTIAVDAPPQVARHEGYETAFFDASDAKLSG